MPTRNYRIDAPEQLLTRASCFLGTRAAVLHAMWRARHVASCAAAAWVGSRAAASNHPALKHGTPISHRTRYDENYVVHFDQRTRDPLWVVERLTKQRLDAEAEHPPGRIDAKYLEAADVPARLRSRLAHYKHSGFDRGHLAPAADHRGSRDAVQSTFYLDNMAPQDSMLNRGPWLRSVSYTHLTLPTICSV